ncbi:MAG: hypothetical protein EBZ67_11265 [Chitinophagia bacterium]|nr:hypothetical protein [Chitinophagia bacterium]
MDIFKGRVLLIATRHGKERVLAPILGPGLGVVCQAVPELDTDLLGTFTGEVERVLSPLNAAREKCRLAMELTGHDLALASEGSFGPHPSIPFLPADEELLLLVDRRNALEIAVRECSLHTNFSSAQVSTEEQLMAFARGVFFPSHALILRGGPSEQSGIRKGISRMDDLLAGFQSLLERHGSVHVETDMRAMYNPTRMGVIEKAGRKLLERCLSPCPACGRPGFGVREVRIGLPCTDCGTPTRGVLARILGCDGCGHQREEIHPDGITGEDPGHCDVCNP